VEQGLPFWGHDGSKESLNKGNFIEFCNSAAEQNPTLEKAIGKKELENSLLVTPKIQRDFVQYFVKDVLHNILEEMGMMFFSR
jgi:hypothetical protein